MINRALKKWQAGGKSPGIWSNLAEIHMVEVLARTEVDWICFDLQHGLMNHGDLIHLLPALNGLPITPLVRVAANQPDQIGQALDAGAHGVIVPLVNSVDQARRAAEACRYPPNGNRSCGPLRGVLLEGFNYLQTANDEIACLAMIETEEGLNNVEEIAAVEGVDGLFVGPIDLCYGLGLAPGNFADERFKAAISRILAACKQHGCVAGIYGYTPDMAAQSLQQGFDFASVGTDVSFIRTGAEQALAAVRGLVTETADGEKKKESLY